MGHARPEELSDLADVVAEIRALPGVSERSPGIFYVGRIPFLHFHTEAGERWADAKAGKDWGPGMPLPFDATQRMKAAFLREVRARHGACAAAGSRAPRRR